MARQRTTLTAAAVAVLVTGLGAPATAQTTVACGDVVTGEVVLTADLVCPDSPVGLELAAGAVLDLGGHRLVGSPAGGGISFDPTGDVTVRNGTVQGWGTGMGNAWAEDGVGGGTTTVEAVTFRDNGTALSSDGFYRQSSEVHVTESRFVGNFAAISTFYIGLLTVTSSRFTDNGVAVTMGEGGRVTVVGSTFARNSDVATHSDAAIDIADSTLRDNDRNIKLDYRGYASLTNSRVTGGEYAVWAGWDSHVEIHDNVLRDTGTAMYMNHAYVKRVTGNRVVGNDVGYVDTGNIGIVQVVGNEFRRNGDALITIVDGAEIGDNLVVHNSRWGIHATGLDTVDLGGNRAWGNGNEPQCVGVVCEGSGPVS